METLDILIPPHRAACCTAAQQHIVRRTRTVWGVRWCTTQDAGMACGWGMSAAGAFLSLAPRASIRPSIRCNPCNYFAWRASSIRYSTRSVSTCLHQPYHTPCRTFCSCLWHSSAVACSNIIDNSIDEMQPLQASNLESMLSPLQRTARQNVLPHAIPSSAAAAALLLSSLAACSRSIDNSIDHISTPAAFISLPELRLNATG